MWEDTQAYKHTGQSNNFLVTETHSAHACTSEDKEPKAELMKAKEREGEIKGERVAKTQNRLGNERKSD